MNSFNTSMTWLLNPERRGVTSYDPRGEKIVNYPVNGKWARGVVDVFEGATYANIPKAYIPPFIWAIIPRHEFGHTFSPCTLVITTPVGC